MVDILLAQETLARDVARHLGARGDVTDPHRRKLTCRCPNHEDQKSSAAVFLDGYPVLFCSACGEWWPIVEVADRHGIAVPREVRESLDPRKPRTRNQRAAPARVRAASPRKQRAASSHVEELWRHLNAWAVRSEWSHLIEATRPVRDYLRARGLGEALAEPELVGALVDGWPARRFLGEELGSLHLVEHMLPRHRLCSALFGPDGAIVSIQGRDVTGRASEKTLNLRGVESSGTAFANLAGRNLLRANRDSAHEVVVVLAEGLTDHVCLSLAAPCPVLSAPGAGEAQSVVGAWTRGRTVLLALDRDAAGDRGAEAAARAARHHGGVPLRVRWPGGARDACEALDEFRRRDEPRALDAFAAWLDRQVEEVKRART